LGASKHGFFETDTSITRSGKSCAALRSFEGC
jgi:hypothetical protein